MKIENFNKKLLVEGNDDQHVIKALCTKYRIPENFDVIDCGGISKLEKQITTRFKESGVKTIGMVIDADIDLPSRWASVKNRLSAMGFHVPEVLPETGFTATNETQKAGVWIMPDNHSNGMLEDFISFLVPEDDKLMPVVHSTLRDIERLQLNKYAAAQKLKAIIHTWLAWQEDPGTPIGLSITKKYLSKDEATCMKFVYWLRDLFKDD